MVQEKTKRLSARERILAAASTLFYQEGVQNVGIDRIIAVSGVAKMSLYNNFKSKDELIAAYLERQDAQWQAFLAKKLTQVGQTPQEKILAIFDILQGWAAKPDFRGCAFINSSVELANPHHPGFQVAVRHKQATGNFLLGLAWEAELANPQAIAQQVQLLIEGAIVMAMMQGDATVFTQAKQAAAILINTAQGQD